MAVLHPPGAAVSASSAGVSCLPASGRHTNQPSPLQRIFAASSLLHSSQAATVLVPAVTACVTPSFSHVPVPAFEPVCAASSTSLSIAASRFSAPRCVWCLLSRLHVSPLPASVSTHLPPQWSAASDAKQWRRRVDMKRDDSSRGDTGGSELDNGCSACGRHKRSVYGAAPYNQRQSYGQKKACSAGAQGMESQRTSAESHTVDRSQSSSPASSMPGSGGSALDRVSVLHGFLSLRSIPSLLRQTNYTRHELYSIFLRFKSLCCLSATGPDGIDAATFQRGVVRLSVEDERFVSRVFALVDADNSGSIEWEEFLVAMAALEKGSAEIKAKFACQVYDLDGDGSIGRQDLTVMFQASSMLKAAVTEASRQAASPSASLERDSADNDDALSDAVIAMFVDKVFDTFGCSAGGLISFDVVLHHIKTVNPAVDVWDLFGRSMLKETRRDNRGATSHAGSSSHVKAKPNQPA